MSEGRTTPEPKRGVINNALDWSRRFFKESWEHIKREKSIAADVAALSIVTGISISNAITQPEYALLFGVVAAIDLGLGTYTIIKAPNPEIQNDN